MPTSTTRKFLGLAAVGLVAGGLLVTTAPTAGAQTRPTRPASAPTQPTVPRSATAPSPPPELKAMVTGTKPCGSKLPTAVRGVYTCNAAIISGTLFWSDGKGFVGGGIVDQFCAQVYARWKGAPFTIIAGPRCSLFPLTYGHTFTTHTFAHPSFPPGLTFTAPAGATALIEVCTHGIVFVGGKMLDDRTFCTS